MSKGRKRNKHKQHGRVVCKHEPNPTQIPVWKKNWEDNPVLRDWFDALRKLEINIFGGGGGGC